MKAVFLDKDGTLIEDVPYNVDPGRITLKAGAREGVCALAAAGYKIAVVTNQSGIARGLFEPRALGPVAIRLQMMLGVQFAGFFHCPHHPEGVVPSYAMTCTCRKPQPGMILNAARAIGADPGQSWMIGDILHDVEAGNRAGCRTVLIDNGGETEWADGQYRRPTFIARDLAEAARIVLDADWQSSAPARGGIAREAGDGGVSPADRGCHPSTIRCANGPPPPTGEDLISPVLKRTAGLPTEGVAA
ncbi:MAG: HAD family hydrolase [Sphingomonas sp.]|uniref:D-glycero-alpha-D-manno-heptose-1,7-bisphosphate 7-phosphatase n=1 Tax=Sphingomonas sp. TaxID=28214 RepID=UPI0025DF2C04|nr:HAD family hydrolase [Sphingomonas sp.]MBX9880437.1 HAD family hydrolase [Sphingomonas sp.]